MGGAIVLLSGGLDSLVSLAEAVHSGGRILALTFDYGQRAARREIEASAKISRYYRVKHEVMKLAWLKKISSTPLVRGKGRIPSLLVSQKKGADIVWVPNRNGLMINIAASLAEARGEYGKIIIGANKEEGRFFPDNTSAFIKAINHALFYSTRGKVRVMSYTERFTKRQILRRGLKLKAPLYYLWSCYEGGRELCLRCHSCSYLVSALNAEGVWDYFWQAKHAAQI